MDKGHIICHDGYKQDMSRDNRRNCNQDNKRDRNEQDKLNAAAAIGHKFMRACEEEANGNQDRLKITNEEEIKAHHVQCDDDEQEHYNKKLKMSERLGTKVKKLKIAYMSIIDEERDNQDDLRSIIKKAHKKHKR